MTQFLYSVGDWFTVPAQCRKCLSCECQNDSSKLGERLVDGGSLV